MRQGKLVITNIKTYNGVAYHETESVGSAHLSCEECGYAGYIDIEVTDICIYGECPSCGETFEHYERSSGSKRGNRYEDE